jgi:hypothetical protein
MERMASFNGGKSPRIVFQTTPSLIRSYPCRRMFPISAIARHGIVSCDAFRSSGMTACFRDNFDVSNGCIVNEWRRGKRLKIKVSGICFNCFDSAKDIRETLAWGRMACHQKTRISSSKMLSRRNGLMSLRMVKSTSPSRRASRCCFKFAKSTRENAASGAISINRSISLSDVASPRAVEPNSDRSFTPRLFRSTACRRSVLIVFSRSIPGLSNYCGPLIKWCLIDMVGS